MILSIKWFHTKHFWLTALLVGFFIVLPFEKRHIFFTLSPLLLEKYSDFSSISFYLSDLFAFGLICFTWSRWPKALKSAKQAFLPLLCIFFAIFLAFTFISHGTYNFFTLLKWIELILLAISFASLTNQKYLDTSFFALGLSGVLQTLLALYQLLAQRSLGLWILGEEVLDKSIPGLAKINTSLGVIIRPYGTFSHPDQLSAFLLVACATSLTLFIKTKSHKTKIFSLIFLIINALGVVITFSRAALAALILFAFVFLVICAYKKVGATKTAAAIVLCATLLVTIGVSKNIFTKRVAFSDTSASDHAELNKAGEQLFFAHTFGVGIGNMIFALQGYELTNPRLVGVPTQPAPNYFLDVSDETGLIGLVLFVIFFFTLIYRLIRTVTKPGQQSSEHLIFTTSLFSILISIIFLMQFDHYFYTQQQTQLLAWSIFGMIIGISNNGPMVQW